MEKNRLFEDAWKQCNEEVKMAKMQLKNIQANVEELLEKIETCEELDAWVQSYLTKADDYLDSVKKYVVFGQDEDEEGDEESTILQPSEVEEPGDDLGDETGIKPANTLLPEPMPPISGYDPDAEETPATDLTKDSGNEIEGPELSGEEDLPGENELSGEEDLPGENELSGEEDLPGEEDLSNEDKLSGEEGEEEEEEEDLPGEDELSGEEGEEDEIEEPDLDDSEFEMPSLGDFETEPGEIKAGEARGDMPMPKPEEEDQLTFDDVDFFNKESGEEDFDTESESKVK
jgi:hypothetical protein